MFDEIPEPGNLMPKARASSSRSSQAKATTSNVQATSSQPYVKPRKLILETTFAVKAEFKLLKATKWAIKEFKLHGLIVLFQPVSPITYKGLVWKFYQNLTHDCTWPNIFSLSMAGINNALTPPTSSLLFNASNPQYTDLPSKFTLQQTVYDICKGVTLTSSVTSPTGSYGFQNLSSGLHFVVEYVSIWTQNSE